MYKLKFDQEICAACETIDCLVKCQYQEFSLEEAQIERQKLNRGENSRVLHDCATCYACNEYCKLGNHPFYQIVELQEQRDIWPAPKPIVHQQMKMFSPKEDFQPQEINGTEFDMCLFPALKGSIQGKLFKDVSLMLGRDLFCNLVYLHFAKSSVIKERVPRVIENFARCNIKELVCFHDECYALYASWAPAYGLEVPFKPVHLFQYLIDKLKENKTNLRKLGMKIAYQRNCSTRLVPQVEPVLDELFELIGVDRVPREYDRETPLCCGAILRMQGRDDLADEINQKNVDDMVRSGATVCVFNCPGCYAAIGQLVAEKGLMPVMINDLCRFAIGEKP